MVYEWSIIALYRLIREFNDVFYSVVYRMFYIGVKKPQLRGMLKIQFSYLIPTIKLTKTTQHKMTIPLVSVIMSPTV
jgi:hypothetical protein